MISSFLKNSLTLAFCAVGFVSTLWASSLPSEDTQPLKSGAPRGLGPLALPNVSHHVIGSANVFSSEQPDILISGHGGRKGLYLCRWLENNADGVPIFDTPLPVQSAFTNKGAVLQTDDGQVHVFWIDKKNLVHTVLQKEPLSIVEKGRIPLPSNLPKTPASLAVLPNADGSLDLVFEIADDSPGKNGHAWTEEWRPYDAAMIWTGGFPYRYLYGAQLPALFQGPISNVRRVSATEREVYFGMGQIAPVNLGPGHTRDLITGARLGTPIYFHNLSADGMDFEKGRPIADRNGITIRHSNTGPGVIAWPQPDRGLSNLIAGGEGALSFYRFTREFTPDGRPIFEDQTRVLQVNADLYAGSLPVPTVVDWNGDGVLDILCGNSEGFVLFFENTGTNEDPNFLPGVPVEAGGWPIQIQAGYRGSVQGVQEARWGYTSPNVVDWNNDGLPDIVMGDITGGFKVFINRGTKEKPNLEPAHPIYCDGLDLHGMWRVRPGVARVGEHNVLLVVDGDDNFHLYRQIDEYNVESLGKLKLEDGSLITASSGPGGLTGRCKFDWFDWDGDGVLDLIIGTCRSNAIPNRQTGFPKPSLGEKPPATVLFMKNTGTNEQPVFAHAVPFEHTRMGLVQAGGAHESGAVGTMLGGDGPNLLVGNESGRLFLLRGKNLKPAPGSAQKSE